MKKVTILDKSTISRQFNRDTENSPSSANNYEEPHFPSQSNPLKAASQGSTTQETLSVNAAPLNPHLPTRSSTVKPAQPVRMGVLPASFAGARRHMYSKAADRSAAINERIERMARKWTEADCAPCSYEELAHPSRASQVN